MRLSFCLAQRLFFRSVKAKLFRRVAGLAAPAVRKGREAQAQRPTPAVSRRRGKGKTALLLGLVWLLLPAFVNARQAVCRLSCSPPSGPRCAKKEPPSRAAPFSSFFALSSRQTYHGTPRIMCGINRTSFGMYAVMRRTGIQQAVMKIRAGFIISLMDAPPTRPLR